ncbi:hypothetical protein DAPPUDRAFT_340805 [Daphnia pulex]|uniref:THAP-type domain-containing protein n=1 Tax=Daphnia pulex TaxID=6669 RepID=E9I4S0_DAPPU|nr:hypothetical protein DAPPUDRAFT_340805 [Daphnia pulex]|eukprot:EFX61010.1 hypothetical protein DAPPUDRAFT_340805 [Daphnia pulex]
MSLSNPLKCKFSKKSCFFCGVNYQDENKRIGIFGVPKTKFASWQLIIPDLKKASLLCEKHFDESDVLKGFTDGTVYHPYGRWILSISASPKHFLGINEASSKVVKRTPLKQLFSVNTQQKKRDGIQAKISSVHSTSNNHHILPSPLGNGTNRHKPLKRTVGTENTPPNQHNKKLKLISHQAPSRVSKSNTQFQSVASPTLQHPETDIIGGIDLRASLNCESETRNAKRLKCETAVRNGPKFWDRFAGPNAGGHTKERNILRNKKFSFSPQRSKLTEIAAIFHCLPL